MTVYQAVLDLHPALLIALASLVASLTVVLIYKYTTDQAEMRAIREELKGIRQKLGAVRDQKAAAQIRVRAAELNARYLKASLMPMLLTFIPVLLVFGWLSSTLAYEPLRPGQLFEVVALAQEGVTQLNLSTTLEIVNVSTKDRSWHWFLRGEEGEHVLNFFSEKGSMSYEIVVTEHQRYANPRPKLKSELIKELTISNAQLKPFGSFSIFGWRPGWLGAYILFSIVFGIALRKALGVA